MTSELKRKLDGAWGDFLCRDPFASSILIGCNQVIDESGVITRTMATDGETLWISPEFIRKESKSALVTVLTHEALHIVALHPFRQGARENREWNVACDKEVNGTLRAIDQEGKIKYEWPTCGAIYPAPAEQGKAAEELYSYAPQPKPQDKGGNKPGDEPGNAPGQGNDDGMGGVKAPSNDPGVTQEAETRAKMRIAQAAAGLSRGDLPGEYARMIQEAIEPKTRWQDILRQFISEFAKDDYSWTRPNPRYAGSGFILPSLYSQRLGRIAVAIDTSGSIGGSIPDRFLGEVEAIAHECRPESILLIDCDAQVNSARECSPGEPLPRDFAGGGGTDFCPVFSHLEKEADQPVCLVYITDLEGRFPSSAPSYPVLWATINSHVAPFGTTIKL